jgi:hypothetical protein
VCPKCKTIYSNFVDLCPICIRLGKLPPSDAAQQADKLLALKDNWDSYGAPMISKRAVDAALQLRNVLATAPSFVPMSDGGVQLEWHSQGFDVELEIEPNGKLADPEDAPGGPTPSDYIEATIEACAAQALYELHLSPPKKWCVNYKHTMERAEDIASERGERDALNKVDRLPGDENG